MQREISLANQRVNMKVRVLCEILMDYFLNILHGINSGKSIQGSKDRLFWNSHLEICHIMQSDYESFCDYVMYPSKA